MKRVKLALVLFILLINAGIVFSSSHLNFTVPLPDAIKEGKTIKLPPLPIQKVSALSQTQSYSPEDIQTLVLTSSSTWSILNFSNSLFFFSMDLSEPGAGQRRYICFGEYTPFQIKEFKGYAEWNISQLPQNAYILDAVLDFTIFFAYGTVDYRLVSIENQPSLSSSNAYAELIWDDINAGQDYASEATIPKTTADTASIQLNAQAKEDIENQTEEGWFAIGFTRGTSWDELVCVQGSDSKDSEFPFLTITYVLDADKDGILDVDDQCPDEPEDIDGFQDEDGCPDTDNDEDGILDGDDQCPDEAETFNGIKDDDGCPEYDSDGDDILDELDDCPDVAGEVKFNGCTAAIHITAKKLIKKGRRLKKAPLENLSISLYDYSKGSCARNLKSWKSVKIVQQCDSVIEKITDSNGKVLLGATPSKYLVIGGDGSDRKLVKRVFFLRKGKIRYKKMVTIDFAIRNRITGKAVQDIPPDEDILIGMIALTIATLFVVFYLNRE